MNNHSAGENIRERLFCQQKTECNLCTKQGLVLSSADTPSNFRCL